MALGKIVSSMELEASDDCGFSSKKAFVHQSTLDQVSLLKEFYEQSGINLDRAHDIQKLIGINMLTQSRNATETNDGKKEFAVKKFASLYSCNDSAYLDRLAKFVTDNKDDEFSVNRDPENVEALRKEQKLGRVPSKLAKDYKR